MTKLYPYFLYRIKILFVFILIFSLSNMYCQKRLTTDNKRAIKAYNNAIAHLSNKDYVKAIEYFHEAIKIDENFIEVYLILAEAYEDYKQSENAIVTYEKGLAINPSFFPYAFVRLGNLYYKNAQYEEAKKSYEKFLDLNPQSNEQIKKAKKGIARSEFAQHAVENPVNFTPVNLGPNINTEFNEYWPSLSADEKTLIITRLVEPADKVIFKEQEDFFISHRIDSGWSKIEDVGKPLNSDDNEGAQSISADGRFMVFTACNRRDGVGRCDLYFSQKTGEEWSEPKNIGTPVNSKYKETQPSLSADGRTLYFASDRPGGFGYLDIYTTTRNENGTWRKPENIGKKINSPGHEMSPFIHPDDLTLYFASNEHIGMGGFDLFMSQKDSNGKWSEPMNLGYPINTQKDEYGMIVNAKGNKAYFSSDRNPKMKRDIFEFELYEEARPVVVSYMKGKVFDADTRKILSAKFELIDLSSGKIINQSVSDTKTGEFLVCIPANNSYMLNASKKGYLFYSDNFFIEGQYEKAEPFLKDVPLEPIKIGKKTVLKNIFFNSDSYELKEESKIELNRTVTFLKENPTIKIEISGHTDNVGTGAYNQTLSESRAKAVTDYLITSGIESSRLTYKGYGFTMAIADNTTEEGRAQNRRTELKIVGN